MRVDRRQSVRINTLSPVSPEHIAAGLRVLTDLQRIPWAPGSHVITGDKAARRGRSDAPAAPVSPEFVADMLPDPPPAVPTLKAQLSTS